MLHEEQPNYCSYQKVLLASIGTDNIRINDGDEGHLPICKAGTGFWPNTGTATRNRRELGTDSRQPRWQCVLQRPGQALQLQLTARQLPTTHLTPAIGVAAPVFIVVCHAVCDTNKLVCLEQRLQNVHR